MLLYWVVILAIFVGFGAFLLCVFLTCCVVLRESPVRIAQTGRKASSKGSYSPLQVVITKKQCILCLQGCYPSGRNIPCI